MNNLRKLRRSKDVSQYELARATGVSQPLISLIEQGFWQPNGEMKRKIARALGFQVREIFPSDNGEARRSRRVIA